MNSKTAKLLNKVALVMAFNTFRETQQMPDKDKIYKNLKRQWYGMSPKERGKSRTNMKKLVHVTFSKPSGAGIVSDEDAPVPIVT